MMALVAGLIFEVGRRSSLGSLSRNWLVGIRTTETLASDHNWETAHRAASPRLKTAAAGPATAFVWLLTRPSNVMAAAVLISGLIWLLGWIIAAAMSGREAIAQIDRATD